MGVGTVAIGRGADKQALAKKLGRARRPLQTCDLNAGILVIGRREGSLQWLFPPGPIHLGATRRLDTDSSSFIIVIIQ